MGLREKKKEANKLQIIKSAEEMFLNQGYEQTTIEQIAEKAEVAAGTIYNYFKSKADLFIAVVMVGKFDTAMFENTCSESVLSQTTPLVAIENLVRICLQSIQNISKEIWTEVIKAVFCNMKDKDYLRDRFLGFDQEFIRSIEEIFSFYKRSGLLSEDFSEYLGAKSIYDVITAETILYLMQDATTFEEYTESIQGLINFIFKNKFIIK